VKKIKHKITRYGKDRKKKTRYGRMHKKRWKMRKILIAF